MKNKKILCWLILSFGIMSSTFAQKIAGEVIDKETKEPIIGASVVVFPGVKGSTTGATTDLDGKFTLTLPSGSKELKIIYVGYTTKMVAIGDKTTMVIELEQNSLELGEVVVTAEFGMKRVARAMGSSAQNVKASEIAESGRDNFISALQGRVSGMTITSSGGTPGSSTAVVLRGVTSISGNNQPLYVVDGVPMNNSTFNPINLADGGASYSVKNLDFSSRGNDFNPEDIESMTVLKGAAAAALYGSDASNGAIIITTKKGTSGKGRVTYSNSFRWENAYGYPDMQTKYSEGAYGTTNYYYLARYGGLYPEGTKLYDNFSSVLQTGFTSKHNVSVEGGTDKASIRAAASVMDQTGIIKTTDYSRTNLSLSGKAEITKWMNLESSMQFASTANDKALRGTDGPLYASMRWPIVDDMSNYYAEDGMHMRMPNYYTDTDQLNPMFGLYKNKYYDESDRFISNFAVNLTLIKNTFIRGQFGWDVGSQTFETSKHPYYYNNNAGIGAYNLSKSNFSDPTLNVLAGYNNTFKQKYTLSIQVGYHQLENGINRLSTYGTKYSVIDFQSINNCDPLTVTSSKTTTKRRIQAFSGQVELGYNNMAFLTLRGRNDWSSTLPKANNSFFYPAVEGSFVLTELSALKENHILNYLKLRGGFAKVGKDAGPLEIAPQLEPTKQTGGGYRYGYTGPNKNLKPEMNTSYEVGFEGRFLHDRINMDATYFKRTCEDQIVKGVRTSYAIGYVLNNMNIGSFDSWGWEGHVDADIIRMNNGFKWNVGVNASHTDSKVTSLPSNMPEYYDAYTWNSGNIRSGLMVGYPVTTLTGLANTRNNAGQKLIDPTTGIPIINDKWTVLGDREPLLRFGLTTNMKYKGFRLSAMLAGRYKATVVNGTKRTMMTEGTSWESVNLRERGPVVFNGVLRDGKENTDNPTVNNISVSYNTYGSSIYGGGDEDWLEKNIQYLRLQELRLSYSVPNKFFKKLPISDVNLFIVGNDLVTWTNYSGIDAVGNTVSAAAGGAGGEGYDTWSIPNPRAFSMGLSVTFK